MLPGGWRALGAALALLVAAGDALPWPANGDLEVELFPVHPGVTQAITTPFQSLQTAEKQDDIHSEDELQSANTAAINHRQKRDTKNDTNSKTKAQVTSKLEDYDDGDMYMDNPSAEDSRTAPSEDSADVNPDDVTGMGQHFFPSFAPLFPAPPLGHSRPPLLFQEPAHSHRPPILRPQHNAFQPIGFGAPFREHKYIQAPAAATQTTKSNGILGSGNFGVIRGGTFYNDNERGEINEYGSGESHNVYSPFYHNGHGRPAFYNGATNPRPQHNRGTDFFANFRDFADINTPAKSSYSEFYVVYMNRNATKPSTEDSKSGTPQAPKPKNIIEQLTLIDQEKTVKSPDAALPQDLAHEAFEKPSKKGLSATKRKLALFQKEKLYKQKNKLSGTKASKDLHEPLIALS